MCSVLPTVLLMEQVSNQQNLSMEDMYLLTLFCRLLWYLRYPGQRQLCQLEAQAGQQHWFSCLLDQRQQVRIVQAEEPGVHL